jgi:hypothetical protein
MNPTYPLNVGHVPAPTLLTFATGTYLFASDSRRIKSWAAARCEIPWRGIMALLVAMPSVHGAVVSASASNWAKLMLVLK